MILPNKGSDPHGVRCSWWTTGTLTQDQRRYAATEVVATLKVATKILAMANNPNQPNTPHISANIRGITNPCSMCFRNASLQAMAPVWREFVREDLLCDNPLAKAFAETVYRQLPSDGRAPLSLTELNLAIVQFLGQSWDGYQQQDAAEFYEILVGHVVARVDDSPVTFTSTRASFIKCLSCNEVHERKALNANQMPNKLWKVRIRTW